MPTRDISTVLEAPAPGEFCHESPLGGSKADIITRLWDGRILAIEAKVTNSTTNTHQSDDTDTLGGGFGASTQENTPTQ